MLRITILAILSSATLSACSGATYCDPCPNDEFCASCSGDNTCNVCVNAYSNEDGICQRGDTDKVKNCYTFASETTCGRCNPGYYVSNGTCVQITIDNCIAVDLEDSSKCVACDNGKIPSAGNCNDGDDCDIANCDVCFTATECIMCKDNYSLTTDQKCVEDPTEYCLRTQNNNCQECQRGFYMSESTCKQTNLQGNSMISSAFAILIIGLQMIV